MVGQGLLRSLISGNSFLSVSPLPKIYHDFLMPQQYLKALAMVK